METTGYRPCGCRRTRRRRPASDARAPWAQARLPARTRDRKSTRLNSSHVSISYAVFCLKKKKKKRQGLEALLEGIETLQGYDMPALIFESDILGPRILNYRPPDLVMLSAAGEIRSVSVHPRRPSRSRRANPVPSNDVRDAEGPLVAPSHSIRESDGACSCAGLPVPVVLRSGHSLVRFFF